MAVLTNVARVSIEQPEQYPVPWVPLYALSVAVLLAIGAKKILGPPRSNGHEVAKSDARDASAAAEPGDPIIPTTPTTIMSNGSGAAHAKAS